MPTLHDLVCLTFEIYYDAHSVTTPVLLLRLVWSCWLMFSICSNVLRHEPRFQTHRNTHVQGEAKSQNGKCIRFVSTVHKQCIFYHSRIRVSTNHKTMIGFVTQMFSSANYSRIQWSISVNHVDHLQTHKEMEETPINTKNAYIYRTRRSLDREMEDFRQLQFSICNLCPANNMFWGLLCYTWSN